MNALIIVAIVLVAVGLLITVTLWLRSPDSAESEYVTVAELQARLEHEQEPGEQAAAERPEERDRAETGTPSAEESTTDTDEPEVLGRPTRTTGEDEDPSTGDELPGGKPDRNH